MSPEKLKTLPYPPDFLNEIGKHEWYNVTEEFHQLGLLTTLDLPMLAAYCNEYSLYIETTLILQTKGRVTLFYNTDGSVKYAMQSVYQKIANDALAKALKIAAEFGLTPSSRTKVNVILNKADDDPFIKMLKIK